MSHSAPANVAISARRALVFVVAIWLLVGLSCDTDAYNSPEPSTLETHQHTVLLRFRSIHHEADTIGVQAMIASEGAFLTSRDAGGKLTRTSVDPGYFGRRQPVFPDSAVHSCTVAVSHFVGYQRKYGGDTTRYGSLDRYGEWAMWVTLTGANVVNSSGETLPAGNLYLEGVPDSVRPNGLWELDVTFDLDGLLTWNQSRTRLVVHTDRVSVRQR